MVSMLKMPRRWEDGSYNFGFGGLSTDVKPTKTWDEYAIANGSSFFEIDTLNLFFYDKDTDSWIKAKVEAGGHAITADNVTATATVDNTTGTPAVKVTKSADGNNINFSFAFSGLKGAAGEKGEQGERGKTDASVSLADIGYAASVDDTTGTPSVKVTTESTDSGTVVNFAFTGLKGEKGDKGADGNGSASSSTAKMEVGDSNTVNGGLAVGNDNTTSGGAAVGYGNKTTGASMSVGHSNKSDVDSLAVGQNVVSNSNQLVVGTKFSGLLQWQSNAGLKTPAFSFIAATNDMESSRFDFAVPNSGPGGIIVRGRNGASDAYYWLKIANGSISVTDITDKLTMS